LLKFWPKNTEIDSQIWLDGRTLAVRANSMIYLPAGDEHEIRAAAAQGLEFFAITAPAFSPDDYVQLPP
jgi:mannose-6-phosphate isomerase-like protein (cupin superfamily)